MSTVLTAASALFGWVALVSMGQFVLAMAGVTTSVSAALMAGVAAAGVWFARGEITSHRPAAPSTFGWAWVLAIAFAIAQLLALASTWDSLSVLPHGDWDAWSIWNLRARMIAGGQWRHAVSPEFSNHPDYPLLTSSFIATLWTITASRATLVPQAVAFAFYSGAAAVLVTTLALVRGRSSGWLAGLLLAASAGYFSQSATQYADIPLSVYLLLAFAWLALDRPLAAGFFAACAAWTKNEGAAFAAVFLIAGSFLAGRARLWMGAAPVVAFVVFFKLALAAPTSSSLSLVAANAGDAGRIAKIAEAFAREFLAMGLGWRHPLLLLSVLALALGVRKSRRGAVLAAALAAQLAVYFAIYIFTKEDLDWLLGTSLNRLVAQIWPCLLFTAFLHLRSVDERIPATNPSAQTTEAGPASRPRRRGQKTAR